MPLDELPGRIVTFTRDEIRARYLRSYRLRNPKALTEEGTQPFVDASSFADASLPLYANAVALGAAISRTSATGKALDDEARFLGTWRLPASGAVGFVRVTTSLGGGQILAGDELRASSGLRYRCIATAVYVDGAFVPVAGFDTGPATNQAPGTSLTWTRPRPGVGPSAIVVRQGDGTGLAGGRDVESDGELQKRLIALRANPPASGNDAQYQHAVLRTPGVPIEQAFTYPGILGPGTKGIVFTLRAALGGSRIPNATHIAAVLAHVVGEMPADDSIFVAQLVAVPVDVALRVKWALGAPGWVDATPWPPLAASRVAVAPSPAPSPTTFRLTGTGPGPTPGTTIAFHDAAAARFRRKTVGRVSGSGPWDVQCETANRASDTTYAPQAMQPCCPWSDSLDALLAPVLGHFARLGPGEQRTSFFDPGLRQRRSPRSPQFWPSVLTNRLLSDVFNLPHIEDVALDSPVVPLATPVGRRGVLSHLLMLGSLTAFPER